MPSRYRKHGYRSRLLAVARDLLYTCQPWRRLRLTATFNLPCGRTASGFRQALLPNTVVAIVLLEVSDKIAENCRKAVEKLSHNFQESNRKLWLYITYDSLLQIKNYYNTHFNYFWFDKVGDIISQNFCYAFIFLTMLIRGKLLNAYWSPKSRVVPHQYFTLLLI